MGETVIGSNQQNLNHFITDSTWDSRKAMDMVALKTAGTFWVDQDLCLVIDESSFEKKGEKSVGVSRQRCGSKGKVDNCQVGVFGTLACREQYCITDARLYLPKPWCDDYMRCIKAGVPEDQIEYKSKIEICLEIIMHAKSLGIPFKWVNFDCFYGRDMSLLEELDKEKITFMADLPVSHLVYLEEPTLEIPLNTGKPGKPAQIAKPNLASAKISDIIESLTIGDWQLEYFRQGSKGKVGGLFHRRKIWIYDKQSAEGNQIRSYILLIRKELDGSEVKATLTNVDENISLNRMAFMQGSRYFIERSFQESKGTIGLDQYQVRSWMGWHHHMAMAMIAMNFVMEEKMLHKETIEFLTANDIRKILITILPGKQDKYEDVVELIINKSEQRKKQVDSGNREKYFS